MVFSLPLEDELMWSQAVERAVRTMTVVVVTLGFDQVLGFFERVEDVLV